MGRYSSQSEVRVAILQLDMPSHKQIESLFYAIVSDLRKKDGEEDNNLLTVNNGRNLARSTSVPASLRTRVEGVTLQVSAPNEADNARQSAGFDSLSPPDVAPPVAHHTPSPRPRVRQYAWPSPLQPSSSAVLTFACRRSAESHRRTKETEISASFNLDGKGHSVTDTGIGFLDHMFQQLAKHGCFDLTVTCKVRLRKCILRLG